MNCFLVRWNTKPLTVLIVVTLLSSCVATAMKTENIEDRVNGRWAALFGDNIEGAYKYLTPGYRSSVSLPQYRRALETQAVKWTSAKYVDSKCDERTCDVKVQVGFTVYGAIPGVKSFSSMQYADETWIMVDDQWYMVPPR